MNLNDRALLVQLAISQWTARKYDKKATQEVAHSHGTTTAAGRYNKSLLPMNDYLNNVHAKAASIRNEYYTNTLPWGIDGTQMLPTANYLEFMTRFRTLKSEWEFLVNEFLDNYDDLKDRAKRDLATLYNEGDYPHRSEIASKFRMDMAVFPVPSKDFRVSIAGEELSRIQQDVERRVTEAQGQAMREAWQRLYDKVKHIAEKCADPKAIFRDSMIDNARDICELLPRLNFADDPNLEAMRQAVEQKLILHPEALRNNPELRRDTAAEAKRIMDSMGVFMGGV